MSVDVFGDFGGNASELMLGQRLRVKQTGAIGLIRDLWEGHAQLEFPHADGYSVFGLFRYNEIAPLTPLEQLAEAAE